MLKVDQIQCHYDLHTVINTLSFQVDGGEICCLLGPSGCGKTTVLRAIAGFQAISQGQIILRDKLLSSASFQLEPERRQIGMVFQDYALFPHLTVQENIRFGIRKLPLPQQRRIVDELLALIKLSDMGQRYPHELSGGQQQRVALVRALAPSPSVLLLDEPFSNLDVDLRRHLNLEVRDILKQLNITAVLVTHDQEEAFTIGDHIGLLHDGTLQQWDTPFNLYHKPANRFVANFIGQGCLLPGLAVDSNSVKTELGIIHSAKTHSWCSNTPLDVLLRPDDVVLAEHSGIEATVSYKLFTGSATLYKLHLPTGSTVESLLPSHYDFQVGDAIKISAKVEHLVAFPPEH